MEFARQLATTVRRMRALVRALRGVGIAEHRRLTGGTARTYGQHLRDFVDEDDRGAEPP